MSKGNAFSFWQKREEVTRLSRSFSRSNSTASEFYYLKKSKDKNISNPLTKREESFEEKPKLRQKPASKVSFAGQVETGAEPNVGEEDNGSPANPNAGGEQSGSPVLRRPRKDLSPSPAAEEEEEELRKFVRKSIRRIKRETRVLSQDWPSMQTSTIPELDPVEVDEEEVEEMLPLVKEILAGNVSFEEEDEENEAESDPEKSPLVPTISVDQADEDPAESRDEESTPTAENQGAQHNFDSLMNELENADNLNPESMKDVLKRSLSALKTMSERVKTLESQLKGEPSSLPVSMAPSGPPPPPPPAPPKSLLAGPKPLVIRKRQGNAQAEKIAGPPQVDMMAEMRKMMARRNERKSLAVKYTHLEK